MARVVIVSFALTLLTVSGCQRQATVAPEAPAEKTDFSPPEEEYEVIGDGGGSGGGGGGIEEEVAPGLSAR